jgi:putative DNA primase/helicase
MLATWQPPPEVQRVIIFGDNDPNYAGQAAAYTLARRLGSQKLVVEVMFPAAVGVDWNDEHKARLHRDGSLGRRERLKSA